MDAHKPRAFGADLAITYGHDKSKPYVEPRRSSCPKNPMSMGEDVGDGYSSSGD